MRSRSAAFEASWLESLPRWIGGAGFAVTAAGLATWVTLLLTGDYTLVNAYFRYPSPVLTVAVCFAELLLCVEAWRRFAPSSPLRPAWLWLSIAAVAHLAGRLLAMSGSNSVAATQDLTMGELGRMIGGPVQMSLLLAGLLHVAVNCRRLRLLRGLRPIDWILLAVVGGFMARALWGIHVYTGSGRPVTFMTAAMWTSDPLLVSLLGVAIPIHRAVARLGHGLLANCWRSYVVGIVLVSAGSASTWCLDCSTTPWWTSLGWYVWLAADCAFALGPAFQAAAVEHARSRARILGVFNDPAVRVS